MEIERKYLVKNPLPNLNGYESRRIRQGYISLDPVIRLRQSGGSFFLTVKGSGMMAREEFEMPVNKAQFTELWKKAEPGIIEKTRYIIPLVGGLTAELDIFESTLQGLVMTEVEFKSITEAESFLPPEWFGTEVTYDSRYANNSLSINGMP